MSKKRKTQIDELGETILSNALQGAEFFQRTTMTLPTDGCELLGILLRATGSGFGTSNDEPAGHLELRNAVKVLRDSALSNSDSPWLATELMIAAYLLEGIGAELQKKYLALIHGGIPAN